MLTQYFPPEIGGAPTRLHCMTEQLVRLGHDVEVVTARPNYPHGKFVDGRGPRLYVRELRNGITVHRVWVYPAMGSGLARMVNYLTFALISTFAVFCARRPDYLFVESPPLTNFFPAIIFKFICGVPYIFNVADLWPDAVLETGFLKNRILVRLLLELEAWSYKEAVYVNAVTQGIKDTLHFQKSVPSKKLLFLPNGVDAERFTQAATDVKLKRELGLDGKKVILWAGTMGYAHGLEHVLEAARILQRDARIHFLFLGNGSSRRDLERLKTEWKLNNVSFSDPVPIEMLPPYYSIADCGLASLRSLPSHEGARPSKILPVLACAKPMIFVGEGETARLIQRAQAGIVVRPENSHALAEEITHLFDDPESLARMGENGRRFVEGQMQWSTVVSSWLTSLCGPTTRRGGDVGVSAAP